MFSNVDSNIEGLIWPAIASPRGALSMAILFQLEKTQWWPAETLIDYQFRQLGKVLVHAAQTIKFYRDSFRAAGVNPAAVKSPERLGQIPLLTRSELQKYHSALLSDAIPRDHGKTFETATTGATGQPVKIVSTEMASQFWKVLYLREHQWHDRDLSQKLAAIRYLGDDKAMPPDGLKANIGVRRNYMCSRQAQPHYSILKAIFLIRPIGFTSKIPVI